MSKFDQTKPNKFVVKTRFKWLQHFRLSDIVRRFFKIPIILLFRFSQLILSTLAATAGGSAELTMAESAFFPPTTYNFRSPV